MDELLKKILMATGISGWERDIAGLMQRELGRVCDEVQTDDFGNVIGRKGTGKKKIMIAAHMDEIGLLVKHVSKDGFIYFIKIGGIDDRILLGQRVIVKAKGGDVPGVIGLKPPHLMKDDERKQPVKYSEMFIDIGSASREETLGRVALGDPVVFEPNAGTLGGKFCYGKAPDNRVGCYALIRAMEKLAVDATVYAVATVQEEVGLKGARISSFKIDPDFAIALDTTVSGDTPGIMETETTLKLGDGVAVTIIEAAGRGAIVPERVRDLIIAAARENNIRFQMDVVEGGMTDAASISMNREGILTGVLSVPCRYIHSPTGLFHQDDLDAAIALTVKTVEKFARS
jgi:endoglucanase